MKRSTFAFSFVAVLMTAPWAAAQPSFPQGNGFVGGERNTVSAPAYVPVPYVAPAAQTYESRYYAAQPEFIVPGDAALIQITLPANAEVWFSGEKTKSTGAFRSFVTPQLEKDHKFAYEVRVRYMENGKAVEKVKKVPVRAGDRLDLRFN